MVKQVYKGWIGMKKLIFAAMLSVLLVISACAMAAGLQENGFDYYVENGEAVVSGYQGTKTDIVVPETLGGYKVTKLDYECFAGQDGFTSVKLPNTLRIIGWTAFAGCENLRSIDIPAGVTEIGRYAFSGCTNLSSVTLPDSLVTLRRYAFSDCPSLKKLVIPANVEDIPGDVFYGSTYLQKLTIMGKKTTFVDLDRYVMMDRYGLCNVYVWKGSWADKQLSDDPDFPLYYMMAESVPEANAIKVEQVSGGAVDPSAVTEANVPAYVPVRPVKEPTLILTSNNNLTGTAEDGTKVKLSDCYLIHEVHRSVNNEILYDLSVRTEDGQYVTVEFNPPEALVIPYPAGVKYQQALKMEFTVEHQKASGWECFSTKTGSLIRTKGGLLLYTSSFSPFELTWEEGADPSQLPQTGDNAPSVAMLMGLIVLCGAAVLMLKRKAA